MSRYADPDESQSRTMWCGPNDGGIKRGDRAETGDNQARPTEGAGPEGSGEGDGESTGFPTADPSSLGASAGPTTSPNTEIDGGTDSLDTDSIDDLTVHPKNDPALGLTDVDDIPPDDWAADTGPSAVSEGQNPVAWEPTDPNLKNPHKRR